MAAIASIDFETRSSKNIRLGLDHYFSCPEAEVLVLSGRLPTAEVHHWHRGFDLQQPATGGVWLEELLDYVRDGGLVRGWNVMFEWHAWNLVCVPKYGWPPLKMEQLIDTMGQAAAHNLPQSLEKCGAALGLDPDKLKSKRGKYLIQRLCRPHKPTQARPGIWVQDEKLFAELVAYCDQDVVAEESIARKLRPLTPDQLKVWQLTQRINRRGVPVDLGECARIEAVVETEKARLNRQLRKLTGGAVTTANKRAQLLAWCNAKLAAPIDLEDPVEDEEERPGHEEPLPNMRGATVEAALARTDLPPDVRRALEIRAAVVQTSTAKYSKMQKVAAVVDGHGFMRNLLTWHGAGPGRWASRGGVNAQNFARPILIQDEKKGIDEIEAAFELLPGGHPAWHLMWGDQTMDAAVSCLRGVIKAPPGYDLIDADFSSVENRVGVWIAGQRDKVDMFAKGLDEYKVFASTSLYNVPYEAVTKDMRQMSKSAVLGCLFGQGWKGLIEYAKGYGVTLTDERSQDVVKAYRSEYRAVRDLWYECGDASIAAVQNPGVWFPAGDKLSLICHKNFLWMKLPSGRVIAWSSPRVEEREAPWMEKHFVGYDDRGEAIHEHRPAMRMVVTVESIETKTRQYVRHPLIGSSIFQSGVQGTAADILAEGTLAVEAIGKYEPVLLAHDECMSLVREGRGDEREYGEALCTVTDWRLDLPLAYEAWTAKRFRK